MREYLLSPQPKEFDMAILKNREMVEFNPDNEAHLASIRKTLETGKLDPSFRFHCDEPFSSSVTQALYMMACKLMGMGEVMVSKTKETCESRNSMLEVSGLYINGAVYGTRAGNNVRSWPKGHVFSQGDGRAF